MTQKPADKKGFEIVRAILDLLILALMLTGAGFGGYYLGIHQRLAPVQTVPPGTAGAISLNVTPPAAPHEAPKPQSDQRAHPKLPGEERSEPPKPSGVKVHQQVGKTKYWISSSGSDYIGYSITVMVNDTPVDNFFGPGKNVNITSLVKPGDNTVRFEAKALGSDYNKHPGEAKAVLTVQVVSGPFVQENFKPADVALTYKRTAAESGDFNDTEHFAGE